MKPRFSSCNPGSYQLVFRWHPKAWRLQYRFRDKGSMRLVYDWRGLVVGPMEVRRWAKREEPDA